MQATIYDKRIADLFCLAYYGQSFTDIEEARERLQKEKERAQKKEERLRKEKERAQKEKERAQKEKDRAQKEKERAQKEKEQEQKKALQLQSKLSNTILNLHKQRDMDANLIASIVGLKVGFVEKVIEAHLSKE